MDEAVGSARRVSTTVQIYTLAMLRGKKVRTYEVFEVVEKVFELDKHQLGLQVRVLGQVSRCQSSP